MRPYSHDMVDNEGDRGWWRKWCPPNQPNECPDPPRDWLEEVDGRLAPALEALGRLHSLEVERFNERRRLEWRFAFTLWLTVAASGALGIENMPDDLNGWSLAAAIAAAIALVLVAGLHALFERCAIVPGAKRGRCEGYRLGNTARRVIGLEPMEPLHDYRPFWANYWMPTVTLLLAAVVILVGIMKATAEAL